MSPPLTHCECGAELPPRTGPGKRAKWCPKCQRERARTRNADHQRMRYQTDPEYRERVLARKRKGGKTNA